MNLIKTLAALRRLRTQRTGYQKGIAALELALTLPIWMALLLGGADGTYFMLLCEKSDRIAYTVTDIVSQYQTISLTNLSDIIQAAGQLMQPFAFGNQGIVIVTSVYKPAGSPAYICWQYSGGGTLTQTSRIGTTGGAPALPNGLTLNDNDNVIISEVYYNYTPNFVSTGLFPTTQIYRTAIYKPRLSLLIKTPT
jgi:Flp pilus assembly protein TadG